MAFFGEADIDAMLADLQSAWATVDVRLGDSTVIGILDHEAAEIFGGEMPGVITADKAVHIKTGALPGLASDASITVDGTDYVVLKVMPYGDGAMTRIALRNP